MDFVELKGDYFAVKTILSVRRVPKHKGVDDVIRNWVVHVDPAAVGSNNPKHSQIWASDDEVKSVIAVIGKSNEKTSTCQA